MNIFPDRRADWCRNYSPRDQRGISSACSSHMGIPFTLPELESAVESDVGDVRSVACVLLAWGMFHNARIIHQTHECRVITCHDELAIFFRIADIDRVDVSAVAIGGPDAHHREAQGALLGLEGHVSGVRSQVLLASFHIPVEQLIRAASRAEKLAVPAPIKVGNIR